RTTRPTSRPSGRVPGSRPSTCSATPTAGSSGWPGPGRTPIASGAWSSQRRRQERVAAHHGQPYFADAVAALQAQQAGAYATDAELLALYRRAGPVLVAPGDDIAPVAEAFEASGINADAMKHFNERVAAGMDLRGHLARISAPALVMFGERDPLGGPTSDEIVAALPDP